MWFTSISMWFLQMALPDSLTRENCKMYEEVNLPPTDAAPTHVGEHRVRINTLDEVRLV